MQALAQDQSTYYRVHKPKMNYNTSCELAILVKLAYSTMRYTKVPVPHRNREYDASLLLGQYTVSHLGTTCVVALEPEPDRDPEPRAETLGLGRSRDRIKVSRAPSPAPAPGQTKDAYTSIYSLRKLYMIIILTVKSINFTNMFVISQ